MGKSKNGWGAAKEGKVVKAEASVHGFKPEVTSSKDLNGQYAEFQGKTLTGGK